MSSLSENFFGLKKKRPGLSDNIFGLSFLLLHHSHRQVVHSKVFSALILKAKKKSKKLRFQSRIHCGSPSPRGWCPSSSPPPSFSISALASSPFPSSNNQSAFSSPPKRTMTSWAQQFCNSQSAWLCVKLLFPRRSIRSRLSQIHRHGSLHLIVTSSTVQTVQ